MVTTSAKWKVSTVGPDAPPQSFPSSKVGAPSLAPADVYTKIGQNDYSAIIGGGNAKADVSVIDEMLSASKVATLPSSDPYQNLLGAMMMGDDARSANASDYTVPYVPRFVDVNTKGGGIAATSIGAQNILDQYDSLEATLEGLIVDIDRRLSAPDAGRTYQTQEIEAMRDHKTELERQLSICRTEKDIAKQHLTWSKANDDAAAKKVEKEQAWWENDSETE
jgi:hypothetical protein